MNQYPRLARLSAVIALIGLGCPPASAQNYSITNLGTLGGTFGYAYSINASGEVAGCSEITSRAQVLAYGWEKEKLQPLATLGGPFGLAWSINNSGQLVGWAHDPYWDQHAALWQGGKVYDLGVMPGDEASVAWAINRTGQVAGYSMPDGYVHARAFLWSPDKPNQPTGRMAPLTIFPGGGDSFAFAINDGGQVAGTAVTSQGEYHAFLYTNGTALDLGTLGGTYSSATSVNNAGKVVGCSRTADNSMHAFLWDRQSGMRDLGSISGSFAYAYSINNKDQIVGTSSTQFGEQHAFLWQNGVMTDLDQFVSPLWTLAEARSINDSGQIAGWGFTAATSSLWQIQGFRLTPKATAKDPEVTSIVLSANVTRTGKSVVGTVTLANPAPAGGAVVQLICPDITVVQIPQSVRVPAGSTTANFPVDVKVIVPTHPVGITAETVSSQRKTSLVILSAVPQTLLFNPNPARGGSTVTGAVVLDGKAPLGGLTVTLSSVNPSLVQVPATVFVPEGSSSALFTVKTSAVSKATQAVVHASAAGVDLWIGLPLNP